MRKKLVGLILGFLCVALFFSGIVVWWQVFRIREDSVHSSGNEVEEIVVEARPAEFKDLKSVVTYHGIMEPKRTVVVVPKVSGRVEEVFFEMGDTVSKGDTLFTISHQEISAQVRQAEASLALTEANLAKVRSGARPEERAQVEALLDQAKSNYEAIKLVYDRTKLLFEENVLSQQELDRAKAQYEVARAQLTSAEEQLKMVIEGANAQDIKAVEAQVAQAQAALELAQMRLDDCNVRAPINGVIAQRMVDVGTMAGVTSGAFVIVDIDTVRVSLGVTEDDIVKISIGQIATLTVDSVAGETFQGMVQSTAPVADMQTRLFNIYVEVSNPKRLLRPGMYSRVQITTEDIKKATIVPTSAIVTKDGKDYVFVVRNGIAELRDVVTGLREGQYLQVVSGVSVGEWVITKGQDKIASGTPVRIIDL